jgi:NADPH:quinone reductase-like Zn-dependent oxidoreductase
VNRSDVLNARGSFPFTTLPRILGREFTESGGISTGETILVTGAAGGVGSVMIARWKGARVIGAIKDQTERARAERAGVEVIVDTSREDVRSRTPLIQVARYRTRQYTVLARKLR